MWSRIYKCCTNCQTTIRKHYGGGLCCNCYNNAKYENDPEPKRLSEHKRYLKNRKKIMKRCSEYYYKNLKKIKIKRGNYRDKKFFNSQRKIVLDRDKHVCQSCLGPGQIIHHIDGNGRGNSNPNNELSNLITLCRACHLDIHNAERISRKYGIALIG